MSEISEVRRLPDGSIDTEHYLARGRRLRSVAAHRLFLQLVRVPAERRSDRNRYPRALPRVRGS